MGSFSEFNPPYRPNREQNLLVGYCKHWFRTRDGALKYQKKVLDPRLAAGRELIKRLVVMDVDTGIYYGELHGTETASDVTGFLARAWSVKADHPLRGVPSQLNVSSAERKASGTWEQLCSLSEALSLKVGRLPSGFTAGAHAAKGIEAEIESVSFALGEKPLTIWTLQAMASLLSAKASCQSIFSFGHSYESVPGLPAAFATLLDQRSPPLGDWRSGPFKAALDGLKRVPSA